jgi:hypothetical protein
MKSIFKNPEHQRDYDRDGYVVVDFFSQEAVQQLVKLYQELTPDRKNGFHYTLQNTSANYRIAIVEAIKALGEHRVAEIFIEHRMVLGAGFVVKEPHASSRVQLHQDYTFTDESIYPTFNIWISLIDTNYQNGALHVLKGSHLLAPTLRGEGLPDPCEYCSNLDINQLFCITTLAGQAIIYNMRTIHASPPNRSSQTRVACLINAVNPTAKLLYYKYEKDKQLMSIYEIDENFVLKYNPQMDTFKLLEQSIVPENQFKQYTLDDLKPLLPKPKVWQKLLSFFNPMKNKNSVNSVRF